MKAFTKFDTGHEAFLHDICYDFYGHTLATCSSDQSIRLYRRDATNGRWRETAALLNAHSGSVQKLSWAHPEFGNLLASSSTDNEVNVYELLGPNISGSSTTKQSKEKDNTTVFKIVSRLVDALGSVEDVQFAPRHLGLKLATCSLDGRVRIYEASDLMNLSVWPLTEEFELPDKMPARCISWNPSPFDAPMLVVGSENHCTVYEYSNQFRRWQSLLNLSDEKTQKHGDTVHDVDWAPNMGRSYHLIATGCKDGSVRIFKVTLGQRNSVQLMAQMNDHKAEVWRVKWNVSGTLLASSGDDGLTRLWQQDYRQQWHCSLVVSAQAAALGEDGLVTETVNVNESKTMNNPSVNQRVNTHASMMDTEQQLRRTSTMDPYSMPFGYTNDRTSFRVPSERG